MIFSDFFLVIIVRLLLHYLQNRIDSYSKSEWNSRTLRVLQTSLLSSPRAESARAFTGRRNSHSGRGEDFLSCKPIFFTETAVTPERKVEKWLARWEINRHAEG